MALDYPLCHVECRFVASSSPDAFGADADRLEMRFLSASDRLDLAANVESVPPSWLVASRISGPLLIKNAKCCRDHGARMECPDQILQLTQLAAVHAHWTAAVDAPTERDTGPRISAIAVESNPINAHLARESPPYRKDRVIVKHEALALQSHDPLDEVVATVAPPESAPALPRSLLGPAQMDAAAVRPVSDSRPSMTEPGQAPMPSSLAGGSLAPARRSLEQRGAEKLDASAMTPQAFVDAARGIGVPVHGRSLERV